jgi:branched-chain amino acid transport system substrate-binding protein
MGKVMYDAGHRNIMTITWRYAAGLEDVEAVKESFVKLGGKITEELYLPFPQVEFQALITQIAQKKPDAVFSFFAGGGAVKFVKDYAAAGLKGQIPLYGPGFLTDGTLPAQGADAEGIKTTLHYADDLDNAANKAFLEAFKKKTNEVGDVYAVQGYDAAALLAIGLEATKGDFAAKAPMYAAMENAKIDSPRGPISFTKAHNVVQNIYLREVKGGLNRYVSVAHANLADPALGCRAQS